MVQTRPRNTRKFEFLLCWLFLDLRFQFLESATPIERIAI
jgi:hypothetical protein